MNAVKHNYKPADVISPAEVSAGVESFFNGEDLLAKTQATQSIWNEGIYNRSYIGISTWFKIR